MLVRRPGTLPWEKGEKGDSHQIWVAETLRIRRMRICGYCVMPNHWHMVLWPEHDGDLSAFLQHLTNLHVKRWKRAHHEIGLGHLYQGRFNGIEATLGAWRLRKLRRKVGEVIVG